MDTIIIPVVTMCLGIIGGLCTLWIRSLLERVRNMERNILKHTEDKIELEIEVVSTRIISIDRRLDALDLKIDKIYEILIEMKAR